MSAFSSSDTSGANSKICTFSTMKAFVILTLGALLLACTNEKPAESTIPGPPAGVDITVPDSITQTFTLPDSINTGLIIATYVEIDPESHTLLMYTGADRKKAKQVRYLNEGGVSIDPLDVVSETLFRSPTKKYEYQITDSSVVFKTAEGHFEEHFRTDANN